MNSCFGSSASLPALRKAANRYALPIVNLLCGSRDKYEAA
jgi:hypothetical protein